MNQDREHMTADASYLGILNAIRWLVAQGKISPDEGKRTASRIAEKLGVSLLAV